MNPKHAELLRIQVATLLRLNRLGRIVPPGPRVFVGACAGARLVRVREDVPELVARTWLSCADETLRERVGAHAPVMNEYRGPAFVLPPLAPSDPQTVVVTPSTPIHPELVARGWQPVETAPYVGVIRDGVAVALCYSARSGPEAAEAGVETAESYRGRGLVEHAVRSWAGAVQATGRHAFYSTQWSNDASRRVAAKLGAVEFGENWHLT